MARVLFIDDDVNTLQILGKAVELLGHQSILCPPGPETPAQAAEQRPNLILIDMMMDYMDGPTMVDTLRNQESTACIPIIILSAVITPDVERLVKAGKAQGYLSKPISMQTLLEAIRKYSQ